SIRAHAEGYSAFQRIGLRPDLEDEIGYSSKRNIGGVRCIPASPANMIAHFVFRNAGQGVVGQVDAALGVVMDFASLISPCSRSYSCARNASSSCRINPASTIALYSSFSASARATTISSSVL